MMDADLELELGPVFYVIHAALKELKVRQEAVEMLLKNLTITEDEWMNALKEAQKNQPSSSSVHDPQTVQAAETALRELASSLALL